MERVIGTLSLPRVEPRIRVIGRGVKNMVLATRAIGESLPFLAESRVRGVMLAALKYTGIVENISMTDEQLRVASDALLLGVGNNDYFDIGKFDMRIHLKSRRRLGEYEKKRGLVEYPAYLSVLKKIEKTRPLCGELEACIDYREKLNLISLGYLFGVAFDRPTSDFVTIDSDKIDLAIKSPRWFESIYYAVMALQVVDDLIGWKGDLSYCRPSFFTALGKEEGVEELTPHILQERFHKMDNWFEAYLYRARMSDPDFILPIAMVTKIIQQSLPRVVKVTKELGLHRLGRLFTTERDLKNK